MARVAILLEAMYEDSELRVPYDRLRQAGHEPVIVGVEEGKRLTGKRGEETVTVELAIGDVSPEEFDALVIPGGRSPERLRTHARVLAFTRAFFLSGKPIAAVCHGPLLLAAAGVARGLTLTSWPAIQGELSGAGARWVDREVVEDGNLVTSRKPADLEAFSQALLRQLEAQASERAPSGGAEAPRR
jgi:protease I